MTFNGNLYQFDYNGANLTIQEIAQQPACWRKINDLIDQVDPALISLIQQTFDNPHANITFCGAGTSAYVGDILAAELNRCSKATVRSVPTTDIVSRPDFYFGADDEGIVFSFARSGNSPESIDTAEKVSQLAPNVQQIAITCNPDGQLAQLQGEQYHAFLMPEETHDKSFVMTSSFSTMLLSTYQLIVRALGKKSVDLSAIAEVAEDLCQQALSQAMQENLSASTRLVCLGSNTLLGAAKEAALKTLEMTAGKVATLAETSLGFRHGPKSLVDAQTSVCVFVSNHSYTQRFDIDIIKEICHDELAKQVIAVAPEDVIASLEDVPNLHCIALPHSIAEVNDVYLAPLNVLVSQIIGLYLAIEHQVDADNPSPSGQVNRVVQGVKLYEFKL